MLTIRSLYSPIYHVQCNAMYMFMLIYYAYVLHLHIIKHYENELRKLTHLCKHMRGGGGGGGGDGWPASLPDVCDGNSE